MFDIDADIFARSRAYVEAVAAPRERLALACGVNEDALRAIEAAGTLPTPSYELFETGIRSPIRTLGDPPSVGGRAYYNPSVLGWVRRAGLYDERPLEPLQAWFARSFVEALTLHRKDARRHAWGRLFDGNGSLDAGAVKVELKRLNLEWLRGGWAVCLRRWNGHHVVTKDLERARIAALTEGRDRLTADERLALFNAIERLDSVMMPFAPYERPHGTPGLFIDTMRERYGV